MKLACVQCGAAVELSATFCSACGRPVDADRDGVPDALGQLIENKAKGIVAAERRAQEDEQRRLTEERELRETIEKAAEVDESLRQNLTVPRSLPGLFVYMFVLTSLLVGLCWLPLGFIPHFIFGAIGYSPVGVVCPLQCAECSGPGRAFSYGYKGPWHSEKGKMGWAFVCHNPKYDADKLTSSDVRTARNEVLQPYMVHGILAYFVEGFLVAWTVGFLVAVLRTGKRRVSIEVERETLEAQRRALEEKRIRLGGGGAPKDASYRTS